MNSLLDCFQPHRMVYLPGASGEALSLQNMLSEKPDRMQGVTIISCCLPGINEFDYTRLNETASANCFLLPPAMHDSFTDGRIILLPFAYSRIADYLKNILAVDVAIAHASPPDNSGMCSLSIAADFTPLAWQRAKSRALIINPQLPPMKRGPRVSQADADIIMEIDGPLLTSPAPKTSPMMDKIAANVAKVIPDGASIQTGIGGSPEAVLGHLSNHKNLTIASGIITESVMRLSESGALAPNADHMAGIAFGRAEFYRFLAETDIFGFASVDVTHDTRKLARRHAFTAINSALEIDLFGQANLEWRRGKVMSGIGGAPDFARGATLSKGGRSIIALPATAKAGDISRIVPRLQSPTASISRADIDTVVTEFGVAELKYKSIDERAELLIGIADPQWRDHLAIEWRTLRKQF